MQVVTGLGDQQVYLFVTHPVLAAFVLSQHLEDCPAGPVQHPDQRRGHHREPGQGRGDPRGDALWIGARDLLGDEFADHQRQVGHRHHHGSDVQRLGERGGEPALLQRGRASKAEGGAGKGARQHADQGDPDLDGREKPPGILGQPERLKRRVDDGFGEGDMSRKW